MPGIRVDGNDVLACYAVMAEAAERARDGGGPDADRGDHLPDGAAHHVRRPDAVPVRRGGRALGAPAIRFERYRTYLQSVGVWTERLEERVAAKSKRLRTELRESVVDADDFDVAEMFDTVYHDITPELGAPARATAGRVGEGGVT